MVKKTTKGGERMKGKTEGKGRERKAQRKKGKKKSRKCTQVLRHVESILKRAELRV